MKNLCVILGLTALVGTNVIVYNQFKKTNDMINEARSYYARTQVVTLPTEETIMYRPPTEEERNYQLGEKHLSDGQELLSRIKTIQYAGTIAGAFLLSLGAFYPKHRRSVN